MSLSQPYCSLLDVQSLTENNSAEDEEALEEAINRASRYVDAQTGRGFWFYDYSVTPLTVKRSMVMDDTLLLPWPVITLTAVTLDDDTLVVDEDYYYEAGKRTVRNAGTWGAVPFTGDITLTGTFGYTLSTTDADNQPPPTIPADIRRAVTLLAAAFSGLWKKDTVGPGGDSTSFVLTSIPLEVRDVVNRYRRVLSTVM